MDGTTSVLIIIIWLLYPQPNAKRYVTDLIIVQEGKCNDYSELIRIYPNPFITFPNKEIKSESYISLSSAWVWIKPLSN